jgi:hypothetical protein
MICAAKLAEQYDVSKTRWPMVDGRWPAFK